MLWLPSESLHLISNSYRIMPLHTSPLSTDYLNIARGFAENGRIKDARVAYKRALKQDPKNAEILSELGAVEAQSGNVAAARKSMEKAIRIAPGDAACHFNLGELERQNERYPQSEAHFRRTLQITPDDADALLGLGVSLLMQKNAAEAVGILEKARQIAPRDIEILNDLGNALAAEGRTAEAVQCYRQALEFAPDYRDAIYNLALCFSNLKDYSQANAMYERAHALEPISDRLAWKWAQVQTQCNQHDKALANVTRSIEADATIPQAFFVRGLIHQYHGDFDSSERDLRKAIELRADVAEAYEKLALIKRLKLEDAEVIEKIVADSETYELSTRASAGFTLYRIYDKAGDLDKAFHALTEANKLKSQEENFDPVSHRDSANRLVEIFDKTFFQTHADQGIDSAAPIFILGMPRSGTTLTEQILAAYPEVHAGGEQLVIQDFTKTVAGYPDTLLDKNAGWIVTQANDLLAKLRSDAGDEIYITDKTPGNYMNIGLISWLFPNAKVIHCKRDPKDIGFSCFEQNFNAGLSYSYDLEGFVSAYDCYRRIMAHWLKTAPIEICEVEYEKLVSEPEQEAKKLVAFCGLEWDDRCLDTSRVNRAVQTASFWQVRQPINTASISKWRRYEEHLTSFVKAVDEL